MVRKEGKSFFWGGIVIRVHITIHDYHIAMYSQVTDPDTQKTSPATPKVPVELGPPFGELLRAGHECSSLMMDYWEARRRPI